MSARLQRAAGFYCIVREQLGERAVNCTLFRSLCFFLCIQKKPPSPPPKPRSFSSPEANCFHVCCGGCIMLSPDAFCCQLLLARAAASPTTSAAVLHGEYRGHCPPIWPAQTNAAWDGQNPRQSWEDYFQHLPVAAA